MTALDQIQHWPVGRSAAAWVDRRGRGASSGDPDVVFPLASVTKPLFSYAVLIAVEEGSIDLDRPAGPPGSTVAHLLSHSSGLAPEATGPGGATAGGVGSRRVYSNQGFELLGSVLAAATDMRPSEYLRLAVLEPLGMTTTRLDGSPAHGAISSVRDLTTFCRELLNPTLISPITRDRSVAAFLPGLSGVLPGFGRQDPNPWGLGFEIRGPKQPHWTGESNSPGTFGHFGASGTFLWIDPEAEVGCVALTDRQFGTWAAEAWPRLSDDVLAEARASDTPGS